MQVEATRVYRVKDVAEHFDVSAATIYRAIESGQLDALKLGTGRGTLRVPGWAVEAYADAAFEAGSAPGDALLCPPTGTCVALVGEVAR